MPRLPDLLERFRRLVAPPGTPAEALGVPASGEEVERELRPLFAELDRIEAEAGAIRDRGLEQAARRAAEAAREAVAIVEQARAGAAGERVRAAARHIDEARREAEADAVASSEQAERIRALGRERIPGLVEEVVACVKRAAS